MLWLGSAPPPPPPPARWPGGPYRLLSGGRRYLAVSPFLIGLQILPAFRGLLPHPCASDVLVLQTRLRSATMVSLRESRHWRLQQRYSFSLHQEHGTRAVGQQTALHVEQSS